MIDFGAFIWENTIKGDVAVLIWGVILSNSRSFSIRAAVSPTAFL